MRTNWWGLGLGLLLTGTTAAQPPVTLGPPVEIGAAKGTPAALPARMELPTPAPVQPLPQPPPEFGVGIPVSPPVRPPSPVYGPAFPDVRPPAPVSTAPIEEPPGPRFWVAMDYILLRARGDDVPPVLVITDRRPGANPREVFASDGEVNHGPHNGFRIGAGYWITMPYLLGVEANYMWLNQEEDESLFSAPVGRILSRPFIDARTGRPTLFQLSTADGTTAGLGRLTTTFDSDSLDLNVLRRATPFMGNEMHWIMGFRYWGLRESLAIETTSRSAAPVFESSTFDEFETLNRFFGAQVGARIFFDFGRLSVTLTNKLAVGALYQEVEVAGGSSFVTATAREDRPGGFLALSSNSGEHSRTTMSALNNLNLNVGYRISENVTLGLGYNLFLVMNVVRPGAQIDPVVNPSLLPFSGATQTGPSRPGFDFVERQFWMHGINVGLTVRF
jgi:hypothetical protein